MDIFKQSAMNLRRELEKNNYTVSELSKKADVSMSSISQYLSGRCAPTAPNALRLAKVLGCNPVSLMGLDFESSDNSIQDITDPLIIEIIKELKTMSFDQKKHLVKYIRLIQEDWR